LTTSQDETGPHIPDFDKDAQALAAYDDARVRYERREATDAEARTRATFEKKREVIRAEIAVAASLLEERKIKAEREFKAYVSRYPKRIERNKPVKPSFWEQLFSFGAAGRMFNRAVQSAADALAAQSMRRRKEHDEEELEQQLKRALYLQEDAIKKKIESPDGIEAFHARPGVAVLWKRYQEIKAERARYAQRLERGEVPPDEQRDREFAERKVVQLEVPFAGVTIIRIVHYGQMMYFLLRDLERKLYHLAYDPRLEPLIDNVLDVYRLADAYEARLSRGADGRPMAVADHYATVFKDEEIAKLEHRKARTALRALRTELPPIMAIDAAESQLIELLANFARTLGPGAMSNLQTPIPPVVDAVGQPAGAPRPPEDAG
jgi:hypothetical protein